jgi:hypothetical protein
VLNMELADCLAHATYHLGPNVMQGFLLAVYTVLCLCESFKSVCTATKCETLAVWQAYIPQRCLSAGQLLKPLPACCAPRLHSTFPYLCTQRVWMFLPSMLLWSPQVEGQVCVAS